MRTYTSPYPPVPILHESIATFLLETNYHDFPSHTLAFIDAASGATLTRGEVRDQSLRFGYGLRATHSTKGGVPLERGDVVMVFSPNSLAWPIILFGSWAAGLRTTLANSAYTPGELAFQWTDSGAKAMIVHPSLLPAALAMFQVLKIGPDEARSRIIVADWGTTPTDSGHIGMRSIITDDTLSEPERFNGEQVHETTLLCYSSGTTGKRKGVETSHLNLTAVLDMAKAVWPDVGAVNPRMLAVLPFFHMYGTINIMTAQFQLGIAVVIMQRFEPVAFCQAIEQYQVTHACIVPPICVLLAHHQVVDKYNLKSLKILMSAAAPLGLGLVKAVKQRLASVGCYPYLIQGYGLTETSPTITLLPANDDVRKAGSVGTLVPNLEVRIVQEDGSDAPEGEPGELWVRGPTVFKGYLNRPDENKECLTPDGWFKTGDIVTRDDEGFYAVVDRRKELIKYKGFQVAPAELESVLMEHPEIMDTGVVGIYSETQATELPRAYVVPAVRLPAHERINFAASVQEWVRTRIANHKYLRGGIVVVDAIPKSASGKILRRELREQAKREVQDEVPAKL